MTAISGIYSKRAYSSKLQYRSLVKFQPISSQAFISRAPLWSLFGKKIYCLSWVMQYHGKST